MELLRLVSSINILYIFVLMLNLEKISYKELNAKQQEIYNFQKASSVLADY